MLRAKIRDLLREGLREIRDAVDLRRDVALQPLDERQRGVALDLREADLLIGGDDQNDESSDAILHS